MKLWSDLCIEGVFIPTARSSLFEPECEGVIFVGMYNYLYPQTPKLHQSRTYHDRHMLTPVTMHPKAAALPGAQDMGNMYPIASIPRCHDRSNQYEGCGDPNNSSFQRAVQAGPTKKISFFQVIFRTALSQGKLNIPLQSTS